MSKVVKLLGADEIRSNIELAKHKEVFKIIAGENYIFNQFNSKVITDLMLYFNGHVLTEQLTELSLNKGIMLIGNYGVGKTLIMDLMRKYLAEIQNPNPNMYRVTSIDELIKEIQNKNDNLYGYNLDIHGFKKPINILINEFGYNSDIKIYGTDARNLIDSFLMTRYEIFIEYGKLTHITCNLDAEEIKKQFPEKLSDRFKEMFNIIELKGETFRK